MTRPGRRRGAVALLGAVVAATIASVSGGAGAQSSEPQLHLLEQQLAVEADGVFRLEYRLTGIDAEELELLPPPEPTPTVSTTVAPDGSLPPPPPPSPEPPPPVQLTIEVTNYAPLDDPDDVDDLVGSDVDPDAFTGVIDGVAVENVRELATVADDGTIEFSLEIGTDVVESVRERLKLERPGVYPLRVQLLRGDPANDDVVATAGTVIQRLPGPDDDEPPPIDLAVVVVVPAPPPGADAATRADARQALDDAVALADVVDAPITLEVPPALVAETAETAAGAEALADALDNDELVALPLLPLDVSAAVDAGRGDAFTRLVTAGEDVLTTAVPTTPSLRTVWITTDALSSGGAQHLRDLGVRFVIVPGALYAESIDPELPETDLFVDADLPDGGALPLLVIDPLTEQLTVAAADEILDAATPTEWSVATAARLLIARDRADDDTRPTPRRSVVLATPDLLAPDARLVGALDRLTATTPSLRFTRASSLIGLTDTQRATVTLPDTVASSLVERVALLDATALSLASAASMLPPDDPRPEEWNARLDELISTGYDDADVQAATAELLVEADALRNAVVLPEPFTFTLTGRSGTIEVRLGNTSPDPLVVDVALESTKVVFPEGDQQVTLRPLDQTSLVVPVEARSNGTSEITLTVSTPAGEPIDEPVTLTSRVTGFTGLGQVLTGGLILVLGSWWFTHWRAKRRAEAIDDGRDRHPTGRKVSSDAL
ncbi:MAG TPA: hypothetical protein VK860_00250 [Ilumatobacteraceae bacterium]|nr:hypothetical protein [Ilumatobacteraceae bacterium]